MSRHPLADILRAIANGAPMQEKVPTDVYTHRWDGCTGDRAIWLLGQGRADSVRIKPETRTVEVFLRWWWDRNMKIPRAEYEHDAKGCASRQAAAQNWSNFGGWLTQWERRELEVEVQPEKTDEPEAP